MNAKIQHLRNRAATYIRQLCGLQQTSAVVDIVASHFDHDESRGGDDWRVRELCIHRQRREVMSLIMMTTVDYKGFN